MFLVASFFWGIVILVLAAAHLVRMRFAGKYAPTTQFSVAVIVPCKGNDDPDFENNLLNIVQQDYDGTVEFVFCVESESDPAVPTLRRLEQRFDRVRLCVAGLATRCAQKTFNVLKGMQSVPETDIFVIADADIQPHPTWLQELVGPFQDQTIGVVTGFFRRVPITPSIRTGDYLAGIFSSFIITGVSDNQVKGVWGGSLAIRKTLMDTYNLYERFATEIVDDIVVMHALHQHRIKRRYVQSCTLKSYCDMSVSESIEWLMRQIQFIQIYFKWFYALFYLVAVPYVLYILLMPFVLVHGLVSSDMFAIATSSGFLTIALATGVLLRLATPVHPSSVSPHDTPYRFVPWVLLTPVAFVYAVYALFKSLWRVEDGILTMHWRSIVYRANVKTGKVVEVIRDRTVAVQDDEPALTADMRR